MASEAEEVVVDSSAWTGRGPRWTGKPLFCSEMYEMHRYVIATDFLRVADILNREPE